jgi:hypothetical protein
LVGAAVARVNRRLGVVEVVAITGLVEDLGDHARGAGAEGVLGGGVGRPARAQRVDVGGGVVGRAAHLVKRPVVGGVERPGGAVRGHARRAGGGVDVARLLRRRAGNPVRNCNCLSSLK